MQTRSLLCASALNAKLFQKAHDSGADVVHLDLEDSVAPALKERARAEALRRVANHPGCRMAVRLNSLSSGTGLRDLLAFAESPSCPEILILSKAMIARDACLARSLLAARHPDVRLFAVVESPAALHELRALAARPEFLRGVIFGAADYAAELGLSLGSADLTHALRELALCARGLGLELLDSPCFDLENSATLQAELRLAKSLGYQGKIAIHPAQVAPINQAFAPCARELEEARSLLELARSRADVPIRNLEGRMVGPPAVRHATELLRRARKGSIPPRAPTLAAAEVLPAGRGA
jgi:citrate lyase beta subunit